MKTRVKPMGSKKSQRPHTPPCLPHCLILCKNPLQWAISRKSNEIQQKQGENMKTAIFALVLLCNCLQAQEKIETKTAEQLATEHTEMLIKKIAESGKLLADQTRLTAPKRLQKKVPDWLPSMVNIRDESLSAGRVGFVDDLVFVDEVLSDTKFRATIYVRRANESSFNAIIDNHSTKGYTDKKRVAMKAIYEVSTEKTPYGETLLKFTQCDIPMDRVYEAVKALK